MPAIVNIINFIRGVEPRHPQRDLLEPVVNQVRLLKEHRLPGTFLIQYDAMLDDRFVDLLKSELDDGCEIGGWLELTQPHVEAAGIEWRGRYPWDWHVNVGFSVGYAPSQRETLIDLYMQKFRDTFGAYPQSMGSWFIDAHTLAYLSDKYGIVASCNCKDQIGTDGYTLWGGYWNQAYYPSRRNAYMPAQTQDAQIPVPVFRMLGSDPIYQYEVDSGPNGQAVVTLEPVYTGRKGGGGREEWVRWFFDELIRRPNLAFGYTQIGQENSFGWEKMARGLTGQIELAAELARAGKLRVETLAETGRWFRQAYPLTPPTAVMGVTDWRGEGRSSVWYNSRLYRTNLFWEDGALRIRDIHIFNENYSERYLTETETSRSCVYDTLAVMDGETWSRGGLRAGLRPVRLTESGAAGDRLTGAGSPPEVTESGPGRLQVDWELAGGGALRIVCEEDRMHIGPRDAATVGPWALEMTWSEDAVTEIQGILPGAIRYEHNGFDYELQLPDSVATRLDRQTPTILITPQADELTLAPVAL